MWEFLGRPKNSFQKIPLHWPLILVVNDANFAVQIKQRLQLNSCAIFAIVSFVVPMLALCLLSASEAEQ